VFSYAYYVFEPFSPSLQPQQMYLSSL